MTLVVHKTIEFLLVQLVNVYVRMDFMMMTQMNYANNAIIPVQHIIAIE